MTEAGEEARGEVGQERFDRGVRVLEGGEGGGATGRGIQVRAEVDCGQVGPE